ncbi:MAG: TonB-dependent receptor domain-containing protein [Parahaliea sp.]
MNKSTSEKSSRFVRVAFFIPLTASAVAIAEGTENKARSAYAGMEEVVVTASGFEQKIIDAPASISVISREEIEARAYRDLTDALQDIPGVTVEGGSNGKGSTAEISIRGMDTKYTMVMVDGRPQGSGQAYYNGFGRGAEYGWLPPLSSIERIEVVRGPMSSLYGSDALGGVINVITRKIDESWSANLSVDTLIQESSDSGDQEQLRYYVGGPLIRNTLGLKVYGSFFNRDEDNIPSGYRDRDTRDSNARLSWAPSAQQSLEFEAGFASQESRGTAENTGSDSKNEMERDYQALSHSLHWRKNLQSDSYVQREYMDNVTQNSTYERVTFNSQTIIPLEHQILTVGAQYRTQKTENPSRAKLKADLKRWEGALFIEGEWFVSSDFSVTGGARWVKDENYGSELVPRLYGVYHLTPQLTFKGGVSSGYRTPDLKQGDSLWVEGGGGRAIDGADVGNDKLKPERSLSYEIAALWNGNNGFDAGLTLYYTEFEDKIEKPVICQESYELAYDCNYMGVAYQRVYQYQNVDEAELQGVETTLGYTIGNLRLSANYTYSDSEQKTGSAKGQPLNNQPKNRANLGVNWSVAEAFSLWAKVRYKGETLETIGRNGPTQYPSYTFVDMGLSYRFNSSVQVYTGIYNLTDKEISYAEYNKVLDGRRYNLGVIFDL